MKPSQAAAAPELAVVGEQLLHGAHQHLRVACAGQPPASVAQRRVLPRKGLLAQLIAQQPHHSAQPLERLTRLVDRLLIGGAAVPAAEQPDRQVQLPERHAPQAVHRQLIWKQRELPLGGTSLPSRASLALSPRQRDAERRPPSWQRSSRRTARQWSHAQPSGRALVDGASCGEPQAGDVSLSDLWSSASRSQRAYADRPRRGHAPPPPRAHSLRAVGPLPGKAAAARGVVAHPAAAAVAVEPPASPLRMYASSRP